MGAVSKPPDADTMAKMAATNPKAAQQMQHGPLPVIMPLPPPSARTKVVLLMPTVLTVA